jgi:hypothetical protein
MPKFLLAFIALLPAALCAQTAHRSGIVHSAEPAAST